MNGLATVLIITLEATQREKRDGVQFFVANQNNAAADSTKRLRDLVQKIVPHLFSLVDSPLDRS